MRTINNPCLNQDRLRLMRKGYLTKGDIKKFVPCGQKRATEMFNDINNKIVSEGKTPGYFGVEVSRVLSYLHITETQIRRFAADEISTSISKESR